MIEKEEYKHELVRMFQSLRNDEAPLKDCYCKGTMCNECPLRKVCGPLKMMRPYDAFEIIEAVEKWSKEHPQKQFKVSIAEFELLKIFKSYDHGVCHKFSTYKAMMKLLRNGCFAGATPDMTIDYYFKNCEVKEDV